MVLQDLDDRCSGVETTRIETRGEIGNFAVLTVPHDPVAQSLTPVAMPTKGWATVVTPMVNKCRQRPLAQESNRWPAWRDVVWLARM